MPSNKRASTDRGPIHVLSLHAPGPPAELHGSASARMDEQVSGPHAIIDAVLTYFGGIDRRAQLNLWNLLKSDTPPQVLERRVR